jgi:hypothetical protein
MSEHSVPLATRRASPGTTVLGDRSAARTQPPRSHCHAGGALGSGLMWKGRCPGYA